MITSTIWLINDKTNKQRKEQSMISITKSILTIKKQNNLSITKSQKTKTTVFNFDFQLLLTIIKGKGINIIQFIL